MFHFMALKFNSYFIQMNQSFLKITALGKISVKKNNTLIKLGVNEEINKIVCLDFAMCTPELQFVNV